MDVSEESQIIFGNNPVLEKLKAAPREIAQILIARGKPRHSLREIEQRARSLDLPVRYLEARALDRITGSRNHQGVAARVDSYAYSVFDDLIRSLPSSAPRDWILFLDGINDPRNFGAILRCAEAAGIRHVVIPKDRSVGVTPTVIKGSAGAALHMKISRVANLRRAIGSLKEKGYWSVGLDVRAQETLFQRLYPEKLVIVLGSEGEGIRPLVLRECDFLVSIPMRGQIGSLNVAVAAGIFFYELVRQAGSLSP